MLLRFLACLLLLLALAVPATNAAAQNPAAVAAAAAKDKESAAPNLDAAKIQELKAALADPVQRQKLLDQLDLLAKASEPAPKNGDLIEGIGARSIDYLTDRIGEAGAAVVDAVRAFGNLPLAERWFTRQIQDPAVRQRWSMLAVSLLAVIGFGTAAAVTAGRLLRGVRNRLAIRAGQGLGSRLLLGAIRCLVDLAPVLAFAIVGYALLAAVEPPPTIRLAATTILNATIFLLSLLVLVRFVLAPTAPSLRLVQLDDETAHYLFIWIRRLALIAVYGYFFVSAAQMLGLPLALAMVAYKLVGLVLAALCIVVILQNRRSMAGWLRGDARFHAQQASEDQAVYGDEHGDDPVQPIPMPSSFWSARRRLAEVWHLLAIGYVVAIWVIFALNLRGGFLFVARASLFTVLIMVLARVLVASIDRLIRQGFSISVELRAQFPRLEERANRYIPVVRRIVAIVIWVVALTAILRAWGLDSWSWFEGDTGRRLLGKTGAIAFILVLAVIAWEIVSSIIERQLSTGPNGIVVRSARTRTLLPLLRNAFLIFLLILVSIIVLSEIGIDTAPLLAGAGVIGLAVGFGAQTLVKDVITGVFILFENTIAVGDVVDVGKGHAGLVEAMSIRTIKLRDGAGAVHTVPFSEVTTVQNNTRDFSYYIFNVGVAYNEDTDRVIQELRALGEGLQNDPAFKKSILDPLEIVGVDAFTDKAVMVQAKLKTLPNQQWGVGREFNRRMKKRFDEIGIEIPYAQRTVRLITEGAGGGQLDAASAQTVLEQVEGGEPPKPGKAS